MYKLGPIVADSYVMIATGNLIFDLQTKMFDEIKLGKFETLDILHHLTSGMKSIYS